MNHSCLPVFISALLAISALGNPLSVKAEYLLNFANSLEQALNKKDDIAFKGILSVELASMIEKRYRKFLLMFPNAKWVVTPSTPLQDGRSTLEMLVTGTKQTGGHSFSLNSKQLLAIRKDRGRMLDYELINAQAILINSTKPIPLTINVPDAVLTGTRYDVDIFFDEPLGEAMVAGGLVSLTPEQVDNQVSPEIQLAPMGGGGLFKSVMAPFDPGQQTWAALLIHPEAMISITKQVRVVSEKEELLP